MQAYVLAVADTYYVFRNANDGFASFHRVQMSGRCLRDSRC